MAEKYVQTRQFKDATFEQVDFSGATFHAADLSGVTIRDATLAGTSIVGAELEGLRLSSFGDDRMTVIVNDVDVTDFVESELDRRFPERVQLRAVTTVDEHRAMWDTVERLWAESRAHAEQLPEAMRHQRVGEEWSFVQTMRHLVMAIDTWIGRMIHLDPTANHPLGLPPTDFSDESTAELGLDVDASPSYDDIVALHAERRAQVRAVLDAVTDSQLDEPRTATLAAEWGEETRTVRECLKTVFHEHVAHRRFIERDLAVLEAR